MKLKSAPQHAACVHYRSQADMSAELVALLDQFAVEYGETYSAYLVTERDREYFWSSGRRGVIGFRRLGRYVIVSDGLLAAPAHREQLLVEFLSFVAERHWQPMFVNVSRNEIKMFRRRGCQVSKFGEEPIVRLQQTDFQGKAWQWARRQENYCRRHGVAVREIVVDADDNAYQRDIAPQLDDISREHVEATLHGKELQFFVSQFSAMELRRRRLFVAEQDGRIIAFVVCNPALAGDMWAVEVYRRRSDAVRGAIPCVIMHIMRCMKDEGVRYVSLSLSPFLRCSPIVGDSVVLRFVANFWWRRLNSIFDVQGLFHFKSRFRPDYREMYVAAAPCITIRSLLACALVWKLFHFNPLRLMQRRFRGRRSDERRQLTVPPRRNESVLRELRVRAAPTANVEHPAHTAIDKESKVAVPSAPQRIPR